MQDGKKGFDPLASLFDAPTPHFDSDVSYDSIEQSAEEELKLDASLDAPMLTEEFEAKETQEVSKEELARALALAAIKQRPPAASRAEELAARAKKPLSAKAALKAAAKAEAEKRKARLARRMNKLPRKVSRVLGRLLSGGEEIKVQNALVMDDRRVLKALWKAHRARMASEGQVDGVVATTNIIRALDAVAPGQLVAAVVSSPKSEFLVWVDLGSEATIAALPDARSWISG
jgi:HSP90 family molecular chaperone